MRRIFLFFIILLVIAPLNSSFARSAIGTKPIYPNKGNIAFYEKDDNGVRFQYRPGDITARDIDSEDGNYSVLRAEDGYTINQPGYPSLPAKNFYIALPPNSKPIVSVIGNPGAKVFKSLKPLPQSGSYNTPAGFLPANPLVSQEVSYIRDLRVLKLTVLTARYNPSDKLAVAYQSIDITIDFNVKNEIGIKKVAEDRFAKRILKSLLINYEQSKMWHYKQSSQFSMISGSPFDSSSVWFKFNTSDEGVYKLTYYVLLNSGVDLAGLDPRTIRIFGSPSKELPTDNSEVYPMLTEVPIYINGEEDGSFDSNDFILFYAPPVNGFDYDSTSGKYAYHYNHYEKNNYFFLTFGNTQFQHQPQRWEITNADISNPGLPSVSTFRDFVRVEHNNLLRTKSDGGIGDYFEWYWEEGDGFTFFNDNPFYDVVMGDTAWIYTYSYSDLPTNAAASLKLNGTDAVFASRVSYLSTLYALNLQDGLNSFEFSYAGKVSFNYFEIEYNRYLSVDGNSLHFRGSKQPGSYIFQLSNSDPNEILLDITNPLQPKRLEGGEGGNGAWRFQYSSDGLVTSFYYTNSAGYLSVSSLESYIPAGLRGVMNSADAIIITYDGFREQAEALAQHRQSLNGLNYYVANITDVYNEFGWGRSDPLAIRYFLRYAFENWSTPKPSSCTLIGDGHYDYLDNMGLGIPSYIPPFEATPGGSFDAWASDDNYVFFGAYGDFDSDDSGFPDMYISRISVKSNQQLENVLNKITTYDADLDPGEWENRISIVADDQYGKDDYDDEWYHTSQAEDLANGHIPPSYEINKIYAVDYPMEEGRTKPLVNQAILSAFNDGSLIIDYIGHGNKNVWMHEHTFKRDEDIPRLTNLKRLPLVFGASCSIGFFDDPTEEGMAEDFLRANSAGGAIFVIAATRGVYASSNEALNNKFFDELLYSDSFSVAEAFYVAKLLRHSSSNDLRYESFGDAELRIAAPILNVDITSVATDSAEDTLNALGLVTIDGEVTYGDSSVATDFNGVAYITAHDAVQLIPYGTSFTYKHAGNTVFRGPVEVSDGLFASKFLMPKDIDYGKQTGKILVFVLDEDTGINGAGYYDSLYLGRAVGAPDDSTGPDITIYLNDSELKGNFMTIGSDFTFSAVIADSSGINMTGQAGHYISLRIDGGESLDANLSDKFEYDVNSYQTGSLEYPVSGLEKGGHSVEFKVWDNNNNSARVMFNIEVVEQGATELAEVMNYPNPFRSKTVIQYLVNRSDVRKAEILIFTLSGLKIRTIKNCPTENSYNFVEWNGRDDDNDEVANGVYIYKVIVDGPGGKAESVQKALKLK